MLQIKNVKKTYGGRVIFDDCSLNLNKGERVALIGPNGTGKTTLFKMISGIESQDSGEITIEKGITLGFLPQEIEAIRGNTVLKEVMMYSSEIKNLHERIEKMEHELSIPDKADHENKLKDYSSLRARFDELNGYEYEHKAKIVLSGLGFKEKDLDRQTEEFSGGWMMRIALAKMLLGMPDIVLMDEPTNHLDLKTLLWFQDYLLTWGATMIFTSHDIDFINHVATRIADIDNGKIFDYNGNYDYYLDEKNKKKEILLSTVKNQEKQIKKAAEFIDRFRAKASKAKSVQSKIKAMEKMEKVVIEKEKKHMRFHFPQPVRSGKEVIILKNADKSYGENKVYSGLELNLIRGNKLALIGENGAGKSTLLKILAGVLSVDSGERIEGYNVTIGYYPQHRLDILNPGATCLENLEEVCKNYSHSEMRKLLGKFMFSGDDVYKKASVLSGGEKSRLVMAKILSNPPNLLLMDEPTNHLDIPSRNVLIEAIKEYSGTLCFISHDVYFIKAAANGIIEVEKGKIRIYSEGYDYYVYKKNMEREVRRNEVPIPETKSKHRQKPVISKNRKKTHDAKNSGIEKKIADIEKKIHEMTSRYEELNKILADPDTYKSSEFIALVKEHKILEEKIAKYTKEWDDYTEEINKENILKI